MTEKDIARINALYKKQKTEGLTPEEVREQAELRGAYIEAIRNNLRSNLNTMTIQYPDGRRERVSERYKPSAKKPS